MQHASCDLSHRALLSMNHIECAQSLQTAPSGGNLSMYVYLLFEKKFTWITFQLVACQLSSYIILLCLQI